jgi:holliday junction DNA helicase RuvA
MIASLRGRVISRGMNRIILDVNGVGYDVAVPLSTLESLPREGDVFLHVSTIMRDSALELYGFTTLEEKIVFELLISVGGIGPRTALVVLSGMTPDSFRQAVLEANLPKLTSVPGVGKKSAERIVVELKEKVRKHPGLSDMLSVGGAASGSLEEDLASSLMNLGYREKDAAAAAKHVLKDAGPDITLSQAVKHALKELMR